MSVVRAPPWIKSAAQPAGRCARKPAALGDRKNGRRIQNCGRSRSNGATREEPQPFCLGSEMVHAAFGHLKVIGRALPSGARAGSPEVLRSLRERVKALGFAPGAPVPALVPPPAIVPDAGQFTTPFVQL
jgi:hypothetical protein